ncbi:MAG: DUF6544 family protein [Polyangiales bacterium]
MRTAFIVFMIAHGAIHLFGFFKAFGLAKMDQLHVAIGRPLGVAWLLAALAFGASAALLASSSPRWWIVGAVAVVLSQVVIVSSWRDARFGTIANVLALVPIAVAALDMRAGSLRSRYEREAAQTVSVALSAPTVTGSDLAPLPPLVQTWLRRVGVVGRARVRNVRARFHGTFRGKPDAAWMPFRSVQVNTFEVPSRLFFMEATMFGVPVDAFHRYVGPSATMEVRAAGLVDVQNARGAEMNQAETVTMFNDLCVLAPAAILDAGVRWEPVDARSLRATWTYAGHTIRATLSFDAAGDLVGFVSNDRAMSSDGVTFRHVPWSTPHSDYREINGVRIAHHGVATWLAPEGEIEYGRFDLSTLEYNVRE